MGKNPRSANRPNDALLLEAQPIVELLLRAQECATDAGRPAQEFAVEIEHLSPLGVTSSLLRWLMCRGFVEHYRDVTALQHDSRELLVGNLTFGPESCFVITKEGINFFSDDRSTELYHRERGVGVRGAMRANGNGAGNGHPQTEFAKEHYCKPTWNSELHELRLEGRLVKRFRLPSPNQEKVISAFEEERWPNRVDDPLPPSGDGDGKRRLHDCIRNLNRNQQNQLIRFRGDGTGQGVLWEPYITAGSPGN